MKLEKLGEDHYRISDGDLAVDFNKEKFEDLYYAVPPPGKLMNNTYFLRLLLDDIAQSDEDRHAFNSMLEKGSSRNTVLEDLQQQIQKMEKP